LKHHHHPYNPAVEFFKLWISGSFVVLVLVVSSSALGKSRLLVLGDSLTAGYGLYADQTFPSRLKLALHKLGVEIDVINAGVSGDTTAGGLARVEWVLQSKPTHVILQLGANDMLRGVPPSVAKENLTQTIKKLRRQKVQVLLAGMYASPNLGKNYGKEFHQIYHQLASEFDLELYPFFLSGVAAVPSLNLRDGIHPNAKGIQVIVNRILPTVLRFVRGED